MRAGFLRRLALEIGDQRVDPRQHLRRREHHQRVRGRLGERAGLQLAGPGGPSAEVAQEPLYRYLDPRGIEHLQVVHLDLHVAGILAVHLGDECLDLVELPFGRRNDQHAAGNRGLGLRGLGLPPAAAAAAEPLVDEVGNLVRVGVLEINDLRLVTLDEELLVDVERPFLDVFVVFLGAAHDQRVGHRLDADLERLGADFLLEDGPQHIEHGVRIGVLKRDGPQLPHRGRRLIQLLHQRLGHRNDELRRVDHYAIEPRVDGNADAIRHGSTPRPPQLIHQQGPHLTGDVVGIRLINLDEPLLRLQRHRILLKPVDELIDPRIHVLGSADDQILGELIGTERRPQSVRPPRLVAEDLIQASRQRRDVQVRQLACHGVDRWHRCLVGFHVVLLQQRQPQLHGHFRSGDHHAVGPAVRGHADLLLGPAPHLRQEVGDELIVQPTGRVRGLGEFHLSKLDHGGLAAGRVGVLGDQLLGLFQHIPGTGQQDRFTGRVGVKLGLDVRLVPKGAL